MRTSLIAGLFAVAAVAFTGCLSVEQLNRPDPNANANANAFGDGMGGAGLGIDPNAAGIDPNDPNAGAYGDDNFENRTRIMDHGLETLYFTFDSYVLPEEERAKAEDAAMYLINNPSYVMIIEGHCDERGSNEYNLSLSEQRACTVRDYILAFGVDASRLQTRAFGEEKLATTGTTDYDHGLNRRAEFVPYK
ncbi:MAG: OmpA family protein [bacterium]|nr:OmpA family protein [bacterium]